MNNPKKVENSGLCGRKLDKYNLKIRGKKWKIITMIK